jgi:hypothetical protein
MPDLIRQHCRARPPSVTSPPRPTPVRPSPLPSHLALALPPFPPPATPPTAASRLSRPLPHLSLRLPLLLYLDPTSGVLLLPAAGPLLPQPVADDRARGSKGAAEAAKVDAFTAASVISMGRPTHMRCHLRPGGHAGPPTQPPGRVEVGCRPNGRSVRAPPTGEGGCRCHPASA